MPTEIIRIISADEVRRFTEQTLQASGVSETNAAIAADVFMRATLRGVGHHDITDLPNRLKGLRDGRVMPNGEPKIVTDHEASCRLDGQNALGEICASRIMEEAIKRARHYGIGLATVNRSNHFLAAHPYVQRASEQGLIGLVFTNAPRMMGTPGSGRNIIGNNPMGFAAPVANKADMILDICWAYTSLGLLQQLIDDGATIPSHWGSDPRGNPTTDPRIVRQGATEPIGGHKGVGLSIATSILTSVLADGDLGEGGHMRSDVQGAFSQTAIVIDPSVLIDRDNASRRTAWLLGDIARLDGREFRYPGQRSAAVTEQFQTHGVQLPDSIVRELKQWAETLSVPPMEMID